MFARIGRVVVRHRWWVIAAWLVATVALIVIAPGLSRSSDQSTFLPSHYESVQESTLDKKAFGDSGGGATAIFVVQRADGAKLTAADQQTVERIARQLSGKHVNQVTSIQASPQTVAKNRTVQLIQVRFAGKQTSTATLDAGRTLRTDIKPLLAGTGLTAGMTGDVGIAIDGKDAFSGAEQIVGIATVVLIIALQLLIFRSILAALLPMVTVGILLGVSTSLIGVAQRAFHLKADQSVVVWITVVLFGVGTDYILFLLFRYRERLRAGDDPREALIAATTRVSKVITSAGAAIVIAFCTLAFSSFGSLKSEGPSLAIAVAATVIAAVTLVPAVVSLLGPKVFWPSKAWRREPKAPISPALSRMVSRHAAPVALGTVVVMAGLAVAATGFAASYDFNSGLPQNTESAKALNDLQRGFPVGVTSPLNVLVTSTNHTALDKNAIDGYVVKLNTVSGVGQASPAQYSTDQQTAKITVLLDYGSGSPQALDAVANSLRPAAHADAPAGTAAYVGGSTATYVDTRSAVDHDYLLVFPLAAVLTAIVLVLLLRGVVAPVLLMASVGLAFLATLGASVLVLQHAMGNDGQIFNVPIFMYLFVVAIGTDYNILMVDRLREENRAGHSAREAAARAFQHAAPTAAAAAVILAGTFASLTLSGVTLLSELGFAVAAGILISAFLMSSLLVPALTVIGGRVFWWPSRRNAPRPAQVRDEGAGDGPVPMLADAPGTPQESP
jgi:putative drug exporter of the RND superfamily